jgi:hypothetical protein
MDKIRRLTAHLGIILSGMILVFYIIDLFNAKSLFMDSAASQGAALVLSVISITMSVMILGMTRQKE